jgi:hypothetical protein
MEQLEFDTLGKWQREGQSHTSRRAAVDAIPLTGKSRIAVYEFVCSQYEHGATDEEIQAGLDMNPSTQRPRRVELVEAGLIKDSRRTRLTRSKRPAVVWVKS